MNKFKTKNGVTVHEYTKEHYSLYNMYANAPEGSPGLTILEAWYTGEYGEKTCVNKLRGLGLIHEDYFREVTLSYVPVLPGYKGGHSEWTTNTINKKEPTGWQKR